MVARSVDVNFPVYPCRERSISKLLTYRKTVRLILFLCVSICGLISANSVFSVDLDLDADQRLKIGGAELSGFVHSLGDDKASGGMGNDALRAIVVDKYGNTTVQPAIRDGCNVDIANNTNAETIVIQGIIVNKCSR